MTHRGGAVLGFLCLLAACSSGLAPVTPPSFVRPERVAFACVRTTKSGDQLPVPMEQCSPCKGHTDAHALVAFVTQTTRGELAAVNLQSNRVIDTQVTVPGFTFVPAGESPTAIVVPTQQPQHTYVVHVGSSDLRVFDTAGLLGATSAQSPTLAVIPLGRMAGGQWQEAEPTDMVLSADEQRLAIAAPRLHGVIVIELADVARVLAGELTPSQLPQTLVGLSGLSAPTTVVTATGSDRYSVTCEIPPAQASQAVPPFEQAATTEEAEPVALALDADNNRVLVADATLPVIHAIDLTSLTELRDGGRALFVTGVPTLDVAVSPAVPVSPGDVVSERYIYAIDAEQRDVLVMNERGVMQSVNAPGRAQPDRLDLGGSAALAIEVIEPGFRGCAENSVAYGPRVLRGVFLAASMIDGSIRVADVYDLDAAARCTPTVESDAPEACSESAPCAAIHRHRPRIATSFTSALPCTTPSLVDEKTASLPLQAGHLEADATAPNLSVLSGCTANHTPAYEQVTVRPDVPMPKDEDIVMTSDCADPSSVAPDGFTQTREPLVCINSDPWSASAESWVAEWEGAVPGAVGSGALLDPMVDPMSGDVTPATFKVDEFAFDFCAAGVEDGGKYALQLVVNPADEDLRDASDELTDVDCAAFNTVQSNGYRPRLTFAITRATTNLLTLGSIVDRPSVFEGDTDSELIAKAKHCVAGQRLDFAVRSLDRYTVRGTRSGFVHDVQRVGDTCVGAPESDVLSAGQAVAGKRYENAHIAFQINHQPPAATEGGELPHPVIPTQGFAFVFAPEAVTDYVRMNVLSTGRSTVSTIVSELRYSPIDARLYAVDSASRGLIPIPLSPLPTALSNSNVFQ